MARHGMSGGRSQLMFGPANLQPRRTQDGVHVQASQAGVRHGQGLRVWTRLPAGQEVQAGQQVPVPAAHAHGLMSEVSHTYITGRARTRGHSPSTQPAGPSRPPHPPTASVTFSPLQGTFPLPPFPVVVPYTLSFSFLQPPRTVQSSVVVLSPSCTVGVPCVNCCTRREMRVLLSLPFPPRSENRGFTC